MLQSVYVLSSDSPFSFHVKREVVAKSAQAVQRCAEVYPPPIDEIQVGRLPADYCTALSHLANAGIFGGFTCFLCWLRLRGGNTLAVIEKLITEGARVSDRHSWLRGGNGSR